MTPTLAMLGCCANRLSGDGGCDAESCMELPAGRTCGDCFHVKRCVALFGAKPENTWCDFFPRRFRLPVAAEPSP